MGINSLNLIFSRIKKSCIVLSQIRFHKSKQKPFVVCCAQRGLFRDSAKMDFKSSQNDYNTLLIAIYGCFRFH